MTLQFFVQKPPGGDGTGRGVYRIIFNITAPEQHVWVLRIRHSSRHALTAEDVEFRA